jgi:hypothetical protein
MVLAADGNRCVVCLASNQVRLPCPSTSAPGFSFVPGPRRAAALRGLRPRLGSRCRGLPGVLPSLPIPHRMMALSYWSATPAVDACTLNASRDSVQAARRGCRPTQVAEQPASRSQLSTVLPACAAAAARALLRPPTDQSTNLLQRVAPARAMQLQPRVQQLPTPLQSLRRRRPVLQSACQWQDRFSSPRGPSSRSGQADSR